VINPGNATDQAVTWGTTDGSIASVAPGSGLNATVTAGAIGTATITVTTHDGSKQGSCAVTVTNDVTTPKIYIGGDFGLYIDGVFDTAIGGGGDEEIYDVVVDDAGHFHAVGYHWEGSHWSPGYYRDNVSVTLPVTDPTGHDGGRSIAYANGNIYIAGDEYNPGASTQKPCLWVGSATGTSFTQTMLPITADIAYADTVRVVGSDVYVSGGHGTSSNAFAVIWKNGTRHDFVGTNDWFHEFGFTTDGRIFALGESGSVYQISADLSTCTLHTGAFTHADHIFVYGNDLYVAGWSGLDGYYWKNDVRYAIEKPSGLSWVEANDIYVHDDHIYIAGRSPGYYINLWIDGAHIAGHITDTFTLVEESIQVIYVR
jgi:hypothetical protein